MTQRPELKHEIVDEINSKGPIPFERFMELALYDPAGGFFATGPLRSEKAGDFLTSPEVSSAFGATIGRFVEAEYERLGQPEGFTVVEAGAGSGSLLESLLAELSFEVRAIAVEASPAAAEALIGRLPNLEVLHPDEALGSFKGVVLANELVDNLPMALAVREGDGWTERWVTVENAELALTAVLARPETLRWLDRWAGEVEEGGIVEVQLAAAAWIGEMFGAVSEGAVVVIDYGDTTDMLAPRRSSGTLRTYRAHHLGPHPLDEPGATDITADANFSALLDIGRENGLDCELMRQDDFLSRYGLRDRLGELRQHEFELAKGDDAMARLRVRNEVTEIETILHPRGLGDFRVLIASC